MSFHRGHLETIPSPPEFETRKIPELGSMTSDELLDKLGELVDQFEDQRGYFEANIGRWKETKYSDITGLSDRRIPSDEPLKDPESNKRQRRVRSTAGKIDDIRDALAEDEPVSTSESAPSPTRFPLLTRSRGRDFKFTEFEYLCVSCDSLCRVTMPEHIPPTWRNKGGKTLCFECASKTSRRNTCPVCDNFYRKNEPAVSYENPWIRCDTCHRWVHTKCDGITDISVYDDDNPGHYQYNCPICREKALYGKDKDRFNT